jgi:glycogen operon protein
VDIGWFRPDGSEMQDADWQEAFAKSVGVFLNGDAIPSPDARGERVVDDSFLVLFNAHHEAIQWSIPTRLKGSWRLVLDTDRGGFVDQPVELRGSGPSVAARSVTLLQRPR